MVRTEPEAAASTEYRTGFKGMELLGSDGDTRYYRDPKDGQLYKSEWGFTETRTPFQIPVPIREDDIPDELRKAMGDAKRV